MLSQYLAPESPILSHWFGVKAILKGRIGKTSIETELIDVDNLSQLWGERYDLKGMSQLSITEDIQKKAAEKLRLQLTDKDEELLAKRHTENPEAKQLYDLGRYYMNKRTRKSFQKAINYFNQAIDKDSGYALLGLG